MKKQQRVNNYVVVITNVGVEKRQDYYMIKKDI